MDPYLILGVTRDCTSTDIKRNYRKLSFQFHPDRNSQEEAKTKILEINAAYEMIGDEDTRKKYDNGQLYSNNDMYSNNDNFGQDDLVDLMKMMFNNKVFCGDGPQIHFFNDIGGNNRFFQQHIPKPPIITKHILLTLEQSYFGCTIPVQYEKWKMQHDLKISETDTIYLNIPRGIDSNEFITVEKKGNILHEISTGDVRVVINIQNLTEFTRNGLDLIYKKKTSLKEALCGFSFEINHINGKTYTMNNKANLSEPLAVIKPNFKKMVPNLGIIRDNSVGNLIIEFEIQFPDF